jgi:hypothetical protein
MKRCDLYLKRIHIDFVSFVSTNMALIVKVSSEGIIMSSRLDNA